jgi:hypothetical protein
MSGFEANPQLNSEYEIGGMYKVKFGSVKYLAELKFIGTEIEAENECVKLSTYDVHASLQAKIHKGLTPAAGKTQAKANNDECELDKLKSQITCLDEQLTEEQKQNSRYQEQHRIDQEQIKELRRQLDDANAKSSSSCKHSSEI